MEKHLYTPTWSEVVERWPDCLLLFVRFGDSFSVVSRQPTENSDEAVEFLSALERQGKILGQEASKFWPGTRLLGDGTAQLYFCKFDLDVIEILNDRAPPFGEWIHRDFFEDFALYRSGKRDLFFGSISHEEDCFFELSQDEVARVKGVVPSLSRDT